MSIQLPTMNQPQRQYASSSNNHVSLGGSVRLIAGIVLAVPWAGFVSSVFGISSNGNTGSIILFFIDD
ncbi:MAG: hypothetical protein H0X31_18800 [Nostocaceae cyanobacterium]|nr:hypothetical protein [Nostocaceae cyanobacterium]